MVDLNELEKRLINIFPNDELSIQMEVFIGEDATGIYIIHDKDFKVGKNLEKEANYAVFEAVAQSITTYKKKIK